MTILFIKYYIPNVLNNKSKERVYLKGKRVYLCDDIFFSHNLISGEFSMAKLLNNENEYKSISTSYNNIFLHIAHTLMVH